MSRKKPANMQPPDFGAVKPSGQAFTVQELLQAEPLLPAQGTALLDPRESPTAEEIQAIHETARLAAEQAAPQARDSDVPPPLVLPAEDGRLRRWRVRLDGVFVLVKDPVKGINVRQEYLDVEATNQWGAVEAFAKYNGIPIARDPLTREKRLASIHTPQVELLGAVEAPAQAPAPVA